MDRIGVSYTVDIGVLTTSTHITVIDRTTLTDVGIYIGLSSSLVLSEYLTGLGYRRAVK